jgi:hypothetical protein
MKSLYAPALGLAPPRDVDTVLSHFAAVPGLAEQLKATGQTEAFCQLVLALHESDLDWWVTKEHAIHAGRSDDPQVWTATKVLAMECTPQGVRVRLHQPAGVANGGAADAAGGPPADGNARSPWLPLDADVAARLADAAADDPRVPPLQSREACWPDDYDGSEETLSVVLTKGAVGNGYLKVPKLQALFPPECIAPDEKTQPARTFALQLPSGKTIQTWVQANRNRLRERFNGLFASSQLQEGDRAVIHKIADGQYRLGFQRQDGSSLSAASVVPISTATHAASPIATPMPQPLNQILFGPPGTGKTYATIDAALQILDPEFCQAHQSDRKALKTRFDALKDEQRVRFVTFHQSFSYEDFVEGLRASTDEGTQQLRYEVVDGVFKDLCNTAKALAQPQRLDGAPDISVEGRRIWKMSLGDTQGADAEIYDECIAGGYALLGYGGSVNFAGAVDRGAIAQRYEQAGSPIEDVQRDYRVTSVQVFTNQIVQGDLVVVTDGNLKFRAIGEVVGDYEFAPHPTQDGYAQKRKVRWLRTYTPSLPYTELMHKKFSQMTLYQLQPSAIDKAKLQQLLRASARSGGPQVQLGPVGQSDYVVTQVSGELVELTKPNGNRLAFSHQMLSVLAEGVRSGHITVEDIRAKQAVAKLPGKGLEPFLVNGYPNILAPLVQQLVGVTAPAGDETDVRVLIIDEINRGNIARIFGELITLLEPSKRAGAAEALEVVLPYSKDRFSVPQNVYLIGTMNTADRSLTGLDVALRRRFVFQEMPPRPELLDGVSIAGVEGVTVGQMLRTMNERIEALLDRDHCLGHAYFMPLQADPSLERLAPIFRHQVLPLLQEYFFDDWQRIQWVLNDHRKARELQFVQCKNVSMSALFGDDANVTRTPQLWCVNNAAFMQAASYVRLVVAPAKQLTTVVAAPPVPAADAVDADAASTSATA